MYRTGIRRGAVAAAALLVSACAALPDGERVEPPAPRPVKMLTLWPAGWKVKSRPVRLVDDVRAVPYVKKGGRDGYVAFLDTPYRPRAFALNLRGDWVWRTGHSARTEAVAACERQYGVPCLLYAVDDDVVFPGYELGIARPAAMDDE